MNSRIVLLVFLAVVSVAGVFACKAPGARPEVLAQVGGVSITVEDLLQHPAAVQGLNSIIDDTLVFLECQERGVFLEEAKYKESVEAFIQQNGGKEQFEKQLEQTKIGWPYVFRFLRTNALRAQLIDSMVPAPTEDEIAEYYTQNEARLKKSVADRLGIIDQSTLTMNDVREDIIREIETKKKGELGKTLPEELRAKYGIKNYVTGEGVKPKEEEKKEDEVAGKLDMSEGEKPQPKEGEDFESHGGNVTQ